jgi:hypothetical protein
VAVVLGRGPGRWNPADASRIRLLLYAAFAALFVSLVPVGLARSGAGEALSIRCGSGALLLAILAFGIAAERALRRLEAPSRRVPNPPTSRLW